MCVGEWTRHSKYVVKGHHTSDHICDVSGNEIWVLDAGLQACAAGAFCCWTISQTGFIFLKDSFISFEIIGTGANMCLGQTEPAEELNSPNVSLMTCSSSWNFDDDGGVIPVFSYNQSCVLDQMWGILAFQAGSGLWGHNCGNDLRGCSSGMDRQRFRGKKCKSRLIWENYWIWIWKWYICWK